MGDIKFGTDGWRAVISEGFTFANVRIVAQAIADYVKAELPGLDVRNKSVVVGYDTRFLSDRYASTVGCVLASNGIRTILTDSPTPTPSISFAIKDRSLIGGVVITASHNPAIYNGIKYKAYFAGSASPQITKDIESCLGKNEPVCRPIDELKKEGFLAVEDIVPRHLAFIKGYVNIPLLKKTRMKVLVDSMFGTGDEYIAGLLKGGKCAVETIHSEHNPSFGGISPEPKLPNLKELADRVRTERYHIGIATDGDADRLGIASPRGTLLTGHKVMTLLLLHLLEDKKMRGDVIQTVCGTVLINKICKKYGLRMHETAVGFKYICEIMLKEDVLIGGEETGGVAFKNYIPERDGILSGLLILEMLAMRKKSLEAVLKDIDREYGTYEYRRLDVKYPDDKKALLMSFLKDNPPDKVSGKKVIQIKDTDGYKFICADESWLMLRLSGTEPILRIYAEASNEKKALAILQFGKKIADKA